MLDKTREISLLARILKLQVNDILKLNTTVKEAETNVINRIKGMANASQTESWNSLVCN